GRHDWDRHRLARLGRLRGHPLRDHRRRDREDHDQPAGGPQRLPAADADRGLRSADGRPGGRVGRRHHPDRRGRTRVLLRRRPAGPRGQRLQDRRERDGPVPRHRPARADAPLPEADRRDGGRLGHRRRARPAPGLRPHDRRGQRPLRPGRPEGRLVRRRVRREHPLRPGGAEEGQGDLVPLPPVRRAAGARHGARQHRGAAGR
ncbi:MAG: Naphthoate synthase, partial [uncultured Nocardioidaceae bacterium]